MEEIIRFIERNFSIGIFQGTEVFFSLLGTLTTTIYFHFKKYPKISIHFVVAIFILTLCYFGPLILFIIGYFHIEKQGVIIGQLSILLISLIAVYFILLKNSKTTEERIEEKIKYTVLTFLSFMVIIHCFLHLYILII